MKDPKSRISAIRVKNPKQNRSSNFILGYTPANPHMKFSIMNNKGYRSGVISMNQLINCSAYEEMFYSFYIF